MTTGRRSSPVPQLNCIGGTAAKAFKPDVVQCKNVGTDGIDVQVRINVCVQRSRRRTKVLRKGHLRRDK